MASNDPFRSHLLWYESCKGWADFFVKTFCWLQVVSTLVSEIILCVKEVNRRTRVAAFELLIGLAHAMDTTYPAPLPSLEVSMGEQSTLLRRFAKQTRDTGCLIM